MKQRDRRVSPGAQGPSRQRTYPSGRACQADIRVVVHISGLFDPPALREPDGPPGSPREHRPRFRHWGVEQPAASFPFRVETDNPLRDESTVEVRGAVLALAAGLTLAVLSYVQFRDPGGELPVSELTAVPRAAVPSDTRDVERASGAPDVVGVAAPSAPPVERRRDEDRDALAPAPQPSVTRTAGSLYETPPPGGQAASDIPDLAVPQLAEFRHEAAFVDAPSPPAYDADDRAAPEATGLAAAGVDPAAGDDAHIRSVLTRWRTAYSALDASAAREVWPSVDARALERAFQTLKSQELRFDRCDLTVDGGRARAACVGEAVYVPRIGRQSPRATPRVWTFELKKSDRRWTVASARGA